MRLRVAAENHSVSASHQPAPAHRAARNRWWGVAALAAIVAPVLIATGVMAALHADPADTWSSTDNPAGAPAASNPGGYTHADLVAVRRTAGGAQTQASFLQSGTKELAQRAQELAEGTEKLHAGSTEARTGAQQLSGGMEQLQAGVGEMGPGAAELADGVDQLAGAVTGMEAIRGQLLVAMDDMDRALADSIDPRSPELRRQLSDYRPQVEAAQISAEDMERINRMRTGSRELANQLNTPGFAFHDGIYSATEGSKQLARGLRELDDATLTASTGATALAEGADKIHGMAQQNKKEIDGVQRALPAVQFASDQSGDVSATAERTGYLPPLYALLIGALTMMTGACVGIAGSLRRDTDPAATVGLLPAIAWSAAIGVFGFAALLIVGTGFTPLTAALAYGMLLLSSLVGVSTAQAIRVFLPTRLVLPLTGITLLAQLIATGLVWKAALVREVGTVGHVLAGLMPLHYSTSGLSSLGNSGSPILAGIAAAVLALIGTAGIVLTAGAARRRLTHGIAGRDEQGVDTPAEHATTT